MRAAVAVGVRTPIPVVILDVPILESLQLTTGTRILIRYRRRRLAVWVRELADHPQKPAEGLTTHDMIWLSKRARVLLRVPDEGADVFIDVRARMQLEIVPALQHDLPRANEVDVAESVVKDLGTRRAIAESNYGTVPVFLRPREMRDKNRIRMSMLTRTLLRVKLGERIAISAFQRERLFLADRTRRRSAVMNNILRVVAAVKLTMRMLIYGVERLLRLVLHAPVLSMRTVEAEIGDDTNRVVRVAPETLRLLGIQPGDEVFLEWGDSRVLAVALEKVATSMPGVFEGATEDDWGTDPVADSVPDHLVVGVSAVMRGELRIPRRTIVNVRRRVLSIFAQRVNELTIPIGGLIFAALALDKITSLQAAVGAVIVTIMAMAPVKYRAAPRGRWP